MSSGVADASRAMRFLAACSGSGVVFPHLRETPAFLEIDVERKLDLFVESALAKGERLPIHGIADAPPVVLDMDLG